MFPIITGVTVGIMLGVLSALGTTYITATVLQQRVKSLEDAQANFTKYSDRSQSTQIRLAEINSKQENFLVQLDRYVYEMRKIDERTSKVGDVDLILQQLRRDLDRLSARVEKYH